MKNQSKKKTTEKVTKKVEGGTDVKVLSDHHKVKLRKDEVVLLCGLDVRHVDDHFLYHPSFDFSQYKFPREYFKHEEDYPMSLNLREYFKHVEDYPMSLNLRSGSVFKNKDFKLHGFILGLHTHRIEELSKTDISPLYWVIFKVRHKDIEQMLSSGVTFSKGLVVSMYTSSREAEDHVKEIYADNPKATLPPMGLSTVLEGVVVLDNGGKTSEAWVINDGVAISRDRGISVVDGTGVSISGDYGTSRTKYEGTSISGHHGISFSEENGMSISNIYGNSTAGRSGVAYSGIKGTSEVASEGLAISCDGGIAKGGKCTWAIIHEVGPYHLGKATTGDEGISFGGCVCAGENGILMTRYIDEENRQRIAVAYVGENGILPGVFYEYRRNTGRWERA